MARFAVGSSLVLLSLLGTAFTQIDPSGIRPFSSQVPDPVTSLDLATSNIVLQIPIRSKIGKIPFNYSLVANSTPNGQQSLNGASLQLQGQLAAGIGTVHYTRNVGYQCSGSGGRGSDTYYGPFWVTDPTGAVHSFPSSLYAITGSQGCETSQMSSQSTDGVGYTLTVEGGSSLTWTLNDKAGNYVTLGSNSVVTDPDLVSITVQSGSYSDTLGATPLTVTYNGGPSSDTYVYTDASGTTQQQYTVSYTVYHWKTVFGCGTDEDITGVYFPTQVTTPTGAQYKITYETTHGHSPDITGRIASITLPSGGSVSYGYSGGAYGLNCNSFVVPTLTRTVTDNNGNTGAWTYVNSDNGSSANFTVTETTPKRAGQSAGDTITHSFSGDFETQRVVSDASLGVLSTTTICYGSSGSTPPTPPNCTQPNTVPSLPITETDVYTSLGTSATCPAPCNNRVKTTFDATYGNVLTVSAYDFGASTPTTVVTNVYGKSYSSDTSCTPYAFGVYINNTPCFTSVTNSAGTVMAKTKLSRNGTGRPTDVYQWTGPIENIWLHSSATFNSTNGVLTSVTDVNLATTTFSNFTCNGMLPQTTMLPLISGESFQMQTSAAYDCNGGVRTQQTDVNGNPTMYSYTAHGTDPLYRLKQITYPDSSPSGTSDTLSYVYCTGSTTSPCSSTGLPWTVSTTKITNSNGQSATVTRVLDGLGRNATVGTTPAIAFSDPNNTSTYESYQDIVYNNLGQVFYLYNPYFTTSDATYGNSIYYYDALGRTTSAYDPRNFETTYTYTNRAVEVVKNVGPNAFTHIYQNDGLGRLTTICEVTGTWTGANGFSATTCPNMDISGTGVVSNITYDALGNVWTMEQSGKPSEERTMTYDGLGRMLTLTLPEIGTFASPGNTINYTYDSVTLGDLSSITSPMPNNAAGTEITTFSYDTWHRLTSKSFSDGVTPLSQFVYDQSSTPANWPGGHGTTTTLSNPKGHLSWSQYNSEWDTMYGYDSMGRVSQYGQCSPTNCTDSIGSWSSYGYDYIGDVLNGNDPDNSATNWTNTYNSIGELQSVYLSNLYKTGGTPQPGYLVQALSYNALGLPVSDTLGTGETESWQWTANGQPTNHTVGSTYNWAGTWGINMLQSVSDGQIGYVTYTYDAFGHLATSSTGTNAFSYGYDQYGNRWTQTATISGPQPSYYFSNGTTPDSNHVRPLDGVTYDNAGNVTSDGIYYYTYDGMNRVIAIGTGLGRNNVGAYVYNSLGLRVSTTSNGGSVVEWLADLDGHMVEPITPGTTNFSSDELFIAGRDWGTKANGTTTFRFADFTGNGRVWENYAGTRVQTCSTLPFGDGSTCNNSPTFPMGIFGDTNIYDTNSNTNHTPNREQSPTQGRWLTPDPAGLAAMDPSNPQTWNLYAYVTNNPVSFIDPTGMNLMGPGQAGGGGGVGGDPLDNTGSPDPVTGVCPAQFENCDGGGGIGIGIGIGVGGGGWGGSGGSGGGSPSPSPRPPSPTPPGGPTIGNPYTDPNPSGQGTDGSPYTFYTFVLWPFLPNTPWSCHFNPNCFVYYGNWGGPGWSGGQFKPLETLTPQEVTYLLPPVDAQDACYEEHDWCYSRARTGNQSFGSCDFQLQQCLRLVNSSGAGNAHSWVAEPLFSTCELIGWPCRLAQ